MCLFFYLFYVLFLFWFFLFSNRFVFASKLLYLFFNFTFYIIFVFSISSANASALCCWHTLNVGNMQQFCCLCMHVFVCLHKSCAYLLYILPSGIMHDFFIFSPALLFLIFFILCPYWNFPSLLLLHTQSTLSAIENEHPPQQQL